MDSKEFFYNLGKAIYRLDAIYANFAKESDVSATLLWILYALNDGKPHTQKEICLSWDLPKSTVNTIIMELKKNGYIKLEPIKGQKREMTIIMTERGKHYAKIKLQLVYEKEEKVFNELTSNDMQIVELLNKLEKMLCK